MIRGIFRVLFAVTVYILFIPVELEARQATSSISGTVTDAEKRPVEYATVVLMTADSAFVKGEITKKEGNYLIRNVAPGFYMFEIRNVAYEPVLTGVFEISRTENRVMDPITLVESTLELDQISITAERSLIEIHPDKTVFNVEGSINAAGNEGKSLSEA